MPSYSIRCLFKLLPACVWNVLEVRQLLPLKPRDNVDMQVENLLPRGVPVLLDDCYSVCFRGGFHGDCHALDDFVYVCVEVFGNLVNGLIMLSRDDERVSLVERSNVEKREHRVVFVDDARSGFFSDDFTEDARSRFRRHAFTVLVIVV